ncbi:hypothetical protein FOL47_009819 [Perkinsus chesapeaki]|uniref:subtilisin n=1 Tax=Perkinsus chesapeaki TaxID=330153 RepID=A0A7J6MQZ8_PERCH|nr:hypothetical protein FOL47_009819 [Perkinsus chesapeaki]
MHLFSALTIVIGINSLDGAYPNDEFYHAKQSDYFEAIRVPGAWQKLKGHERGIRTVAIIDSGMESSHPDLKANAVVGYNIVDKNTDTHDRDGHGTEMAGVIGAVINNAIGIAGITDYVKLMPIYDGDAVSDEYTAASIEYAVSKHVDVILYAPSQDKPFGDRSISALEKASNAGIPFICTAGNDGIDISKPKNVVYPCEYTKSMDVVVCVAATDEDSMDLLDTSNYAPSIDVAAPRDVFTTALQGKYHGSSGTSVAAAIVAGVVAMMKSASKETLTVKEVKCIIKESSVPGVETDEGVPMAFGRLDALGTIERILH